MVPDGGPSGSVRASKPAREAFALERFAWGGPDRLVLAGRFLALDDTPQAPVLILHGTERTHRLAAIAEGAPEAGSPWEAAFVWQQAPEPFTTAELELGPGVTVALPEPRDRRPRFRHEVLEVQRAAAEAAPEDAPAKRVWLEGELLTASERNRELVAEVELAREELARAQRVLETERERHSGDAERFRTGIARVQSSAQEALAAEQARAEQLTAELGAARADADTQRRRAEESEQAHREAHAALEGIAEAREAAAAARADAEQLRRRLETIWSALGGSR